MLEKEKEWYDVEVEDEFFHDDVKELKGFSDLLNKPKAKPAKKAVLNRVSVQTEVSVADGEQEPEVEVSSRPSFEEIVNPITKAKPANNSLEDMEVQSMIDETSDNVANLEDDDDEKQPKLTFEEYVVENELNLDNLKANISAALYIAGDDGLDIATLKKVVEQPSWFVKKLLTIMIGEYWKNEASGICIELYQRVFKFVTKAKCFDALGKVINVKFKNPLSQSVMETLAIVAYNQPCRRSVIEKIRDKDPKAALDKLLSLELISARQSSEPGRPFVYSVTNKFYDLFDLKSLSQLPKIEPRLLNDLPTNESEIEE